METKFIHHTKQDPWSADTINWKDNFDALKGQRMSGEKKATAKKSMKGEHDRLYAEGYKAAMLDMLYLDGQDQQAYDPYAQAQQMLDGPPPVDPYSKLLG